MEEKEREWKRARTARTEYAMDVESVQAWVRAAELTAKERTLAPQAYKERLVSTRSEIPSVADRMEKLSRNARAIIEGSRDAGERQLIQSTVTALSEQFSAVCSELEARQAAVEDACDAVARFLALLEKVLLWVETQRAFLARPLPLADLQEAQQKQTEYGNALKSCKQQAKNLADMAKEIEVVERVTSPGDLPSRLEAAENATVDVEKKLAKTNGLLQELAEEWERCEKKLKDAGHWIEATSRTLEAPHSTKKPLRDRLALREKLINDISTQKTKISYAVEKLNVHFGPEGVASQSQFPEGVQIMARDLCESLDALSARTSAQAQQLAAALAQVEAYCADIVRLRTQLLDAEQRLRHAAQPNYSPRDPDTKLRHQQEFTRRIEELTRSIFELDPFYVVEDDPAATLAMLVSTADRARANRRPRSPERRDTRSPATPAWLLPGTTYAEIVKGQNSRSSSINSRHHSAQRLTHRMQTPEAMEIESKQPVITDMQTESASPEMIKQSDSVVRKSSPCVSEVMDYSETQQCRSSESDIYSENICFSSVLETQNYLCHRDDDVNESSIIQKNPSPTVETHSPETLTVTQLQRQEDRSRSMSPTAKYRSQDLSYAEILALGLKKQTKSQIIMSLPKPHVAQVEMVKEIIVEVEKAPQPLLIDQKEPSKETTKVRSERLEKPERPAQRSRSRDMPRQRRAPEKRPTKTNDVQTKKKKLQKKVIEVDEFEEMPEISSKEQTKLEVMQPDVEIITKTIRKDNVILKPSSTVSLDTKSTSDIEETKSDVVSEPSHKKHKKKHKSKKIKDDDEIERALKEIEIITKTIRKDDVILKPSSTVSLDTKSTSDIEETKSDVVSDPSHKKHKKKHKPKKVKEDDDEIERALKEIEMNTSKQRKKKQKVTNEKPKENLDVCKENPESLGLQEEPKKLGLSLKELPKSTVSLSEEKQEEKELSQDISFTKNIKKTTQKLIDSESKLDEIIIETKVTDSPNSDSMKYKKKKKGKRNKTTSEVITEKLCENESSVQIQSKPKPQIQIEINEELLKINKETKENLITLDWNALMEEEENISESYVSLDEGKINDLSSHIATEVNILPEKDETADLKGILQTDIFSETNQEEICIKQNKSNLSCETPDQVKETEIAEDVTSTLSNVKDDEQKLDRNKYNVTENTDQIENTERTPTTNWELPLREIQHTKIIHDLGVKKILLDNNREIGISDKNEIIFSPDDKTCDSIDNVQTSSNTSNKSEQNNNYEFLSTNPLKEVKNTEEIKTFKPQEVDTHTVYLITHEEKKLPPIRTVKVFTNKDNPDDNTIKNLSDDQFTPILDDEKVDNEKYTEEAQSLDVAYTEQLSKNILNETVDKSTPLSMSVLENKLDSCDTTIEETENPILEEVIFGSVQDRKKPQTKKYTSIPYKELTEEIKTYSLDLDYQQLDYRFYQLIKNESEEIQTESLEDNDLPLYSNIPDQIDSPGNEAILEVSYNDIVEIPTSTESNSDVSNNHVDISTIAVSETTILRSYSEIMDSEKMLNLLNTSSDEKQNKDNITAFSKVSEKDEIKSALNEVIDQKDMPNILEEKQEAKYDLANYLILDSPKYNYSDLRDAEMLINVTKQNHKDVLPIICPNNVKKTEQMQDMDIKAEDVCLANVSALSPSRNDTTVTEAIIEKTCNILSNSTFGQVPCNYQEIKNAEELLGLKNSREVSKEPRMKCEREEFEKTEPCAPSISDNSVQQNKEKLQLSRLQSLEVPCFSYVDIRDAEILLARLSNVMPKESTSEKTMVAELDSRDTYAKSNEPSTNETLNQSIDSNIQLSNGTITVVSEKSIIEIPRFNYQEINDAELTLAKVLEDLSLSNETSTGKTIDVAANFSKSMSDARPKENEKELLKSSGVITPDRVEENSSDSETVTPLINIIYGKLDNIEPSSVIQTTDEDNLVTEEDEFVIVDMIENVNKEVDSKIKELTKELENTTVEVNRKDSSSLNVVDTKLVDDKFENKKISEKYEAISNLDVPDDQCTLMEDKIMSDTETDFEIISTHIGDDFQDLEIMEPGPVSAVDDSITHTIQASDAHQTQFSDTPGQIDTEIESTDLNKFNVDKNEYEIVTTNTDNLRVEKSPIHSLHDLLPEIDSIPEFKPSYPNTFFSNLSADAPEFTPSYMYQNIVTDTVPKAVEKQDQSEDSANEVKDKEKQTFMCSSILSTDKIDELNQDSLKTQNLTKISTKPIDEKLKKQNEKEISHVTQTKENSATDNTKERFIPRTSPDKDATLLEIKTDTSNVWSKMLDDSKSYADILAEGLLPEEEPIDHQDIKTFKESSADVEPEKPIEVNVIDENTKVETENSWAKIAASKSQNISKGKVEQPIAAPIISQHKTPIILVDETDLDHKVQKEVDAEGFITVERSRRSRSRSKEIRSTSVPKTNQTTSTRDKSENRFDALLDTLKSDDVESVQSVNLEDQQESKHKPRKTRSPVTKETSQISKNKTKDKPQKIKEVYDKSSEVVQSDVALESKESENKKKLKKKKKNKKSTNVSEGSHEAEVLPNRLMEETKIITSDPLGTSVSTPESIQTPVKDRFYSDAQYWKVDASEINDLSNLSETITIELGSEQELQFKTDLSPQLDSHLTEPVVAKIQQPLGLNQENATIQTSMSEEQSLECKMADLQREIEEMLLPENDNSIISDVTPQELADTNESIDEQDDITGHMSPSLASPEPEDYQQIPNDEEQNTFMESEIILTDTPSTTTLDANIEIKQEIKREKDETENLSSEKSPSDQNNVDFTSLPTNSDFITNNQNLKTDKFWVEKSIIDDAEKLMVEQIPNVVNKLETNEISKFANKPAMDEVVLDIKPKSVTLEKHLNNDNTFWPEKYLYHDAECQYFLRKEMKKKPNTETYKHIETKDDKDRDPGSGSGHSSDAEEKDPRRSCGSPFDSNYISMDLPGGICSWKDHSSYLSIETPTDSLLESVSESHVGLEISEDSLTTPTLEPVALPAPPQEPPVAAPARTTKELSNDIETLLKEVKIVQANLSDLPNESLDAMEQGLREGISILVKCGEAADMLEQKMMEFRQESEVQNLMKDLVIMKGRIAKLLVQARQGLVTIQEAKKEVAKQKEEIEEQNVKINKLDTWIETINTELKESTQQSDILTEDIILRYIEIYERYIREYEEYEIILKSISVSIRDESSQVKEKVTVTKNTLEETRNLVINEIERLREILLQLRSAPEVIEEDISQTDRTIDSTSMPEEVVSPRETKEEKQILEEPFLLESNITQVETEIKEPSKTKLKKTETIETQTGKSLMSDEPSVTDKSVICQPDPISTHDVSITCAPPKEIEVQTSEPTSKEKEMMQNIEIKKTISDGHETIEIQSKPIIREVKSDEKSLIIGADYKDSDVHKNSTLNITHSLPQSFETVMVEPDETTTEVVVDADGTKRIIVKKVRKTLVTRQQVVHSQQQKQEFFSSEDIPHDQTFSQISITGDGGSTTSALEGGVMQNIQYQTYGGEIVSTLPSGEVTIHEFTSKPDMVIALEGNLKPEEILKIAEGEIKPHIETSSSSVTAVVQQVTKRIVTKRRRIIRKIVVIDGKEHVSEEIIEEPENVEISEEQIPRVSINITDDDLHVQHTETDDKRDDDNKKPFDLSDNKPIRESSKKDGSQTSPETKQSEMHEARHIQEPKKDVKEEMVRTNLKHVVKEFIQNEGTIDVKDSAAIDSKSDKADQIDSTILKRKIETVAPQEYVGDSTHQSSMVNVSSVIQKITRKIKKKRIIKHIKIIDGKEYVTEEVIEEPEDVEIIEEEPIVTHSMQEQNVRTKRIRVIKQVQVIDGKEYVTEQVIEDSGDENEPTSMIPAEFDYNVIPSETTDYVVTLPREEIHTQTREGSQEVTKENESDEQMSKFVEPEERKVIEKLQQGTDNLQVQPTNIPEFNIKESVIQTLETISPDIKYSTKTMAAELETDTDKTDKDIGITDEFETSQNQQESSLLLSDLRSKQDNIKTKTKNDNTEENIQQIEKEQIKKGSVLGQPQSTTNIMDITQSLIGSEIEHSNLCKTPAQISKLPSEQENNPFCTTSIITIDKSINIKGDIDGQKEEYSEDNVHIKDVQDISDLQSKEKLTVTEETIPQTEEINIYHKKQVSPEIKSEMKQKYPMQDETAHVTEVASKLQNSERVVIQEPVKQISLLSKGDVDSTHSQIVVKQTKVIKRIEIIDGKEHVTEEVVEEPDHLEMTDNPAFAHILQQEGVTTKRIKIIRQIHLIDGKEHITEQVVEEPSDKIISDSTVTAEIDVSLSKPDLENVEKIAPIKNVLKNSDNINEELSNFIAHERSHAEQGTTVKIVSSDLNDEIERQKPEIPKDDQKPLELTENVKVSEIKDDVKCQKPKISKEDVKVPEIKDDVKHQKPEISKDNEVLKIKYDVEHQKPEISEVNEKAPEIKDDLKCQKRKISKENEKISEIKDDVQHQDPDISKDNEVPVKDAVEHQKPVISKDNEKVSELKDDVEHKKSKISKENEKDSVPDQTMIREIKLDQFRDEKMLENNTKISSNINRETENPLEDKSVVEGEVENLKLLNQQTIHVVCPPELTSTNASKENEKIKVEPSPGLSYVEVGTPIVESIILSDDNVLPEVSEVSYIDQFEPKKNEPFEETHPITLHREHKPAQVDVSSRPSLNVIQDTNSFINAERQNLGPVTTNNLTQTEKLEVEPMKLSEKVDIKMTITKLDGKSEMEPTVGLNMSIEKFDSNEPNLVKKDIEMHLPSEVKITHNVQEKSPDMGVSSECFTGTTIPDVDKKDKKRKIKHKKSSESESLGTETPLKTAEKSIDDTDSSSLSHYVDLPAATPIESPKPTKEVLKDVQLICSESPLESDKVKSVEDQDYEPGGESAEQGLTEKKKKLKKRQSRKSSQDTLYPEEKPPDVDDIVLCSSEETIIKKKGKGKKGKKKLETSEICDEIEKALLPVSAQEITTASPKEESYHTMSETSDISTVKIVEECIGKSPDLIKDNITTTITYPVSVLEEIPTREYSIQTSPDLSEQKSELESVRKPETVEFILQTSPTSVSDVFIQTISKEEKEIDTQTNENVKCIENIDALDTYVQTSRNESPEQTIKLEATTQVIPYDIILPDEKSSQTSPSIEQVPQPKLETDSREIQTSPVPTVQSDEKATEISIETIDSTIQTISQENTDQETNTSPVVPLSFSNMSIQTSGIPTTSTFTQSDQDVSKVPNINVEEKSTICEKIDTSDASQQTSPRLIIDERKVETPIKEVITVDTTQQTTPREEKLNFDDVTSEETTKDKIFIVESSQQTTPRQEVEKAPGKEVVKSTITVDSVQQTSPRSYTDDSITTSTDEPYEVHLRAQISIPQATNDFLDRERQPTDYPQTILADKHKQRKKKLRRKAESPLKSPESLSDPINAELSLSMTPTSDDMSGKDSYSIDEGIYQHIPTGVTSTKESLATHGRPTYSDIVQRSKSKSPSPSKTLVTPKSDKAKLLHSLEKRTQATYDPQKNSEDSMTVALIEPSVEKSYDVVVNSKLEEVKNAIESKDPNKIEKTVIVVIETISIWLQEIQYKIHGAISSGVKERDEAQRIKDLEQYVQHLKEIVYVTEVHEEIVTLIETLTRQLNAVSNLSNESGLKVKEGEEDWRKFLNEIERLSQSVDKIKERLEDLITLEVPTSQKLEGLDKIENDNSDNSGNVRKMFKVYRTLVESNPKRECPSKLYLCDDDTKQIENAINVERDRLLQLASLAEEYEQTLQDFGQITDVAEALLDGKIIVSNLDHLHEEIQKHRKFFVNLSHCRAILESLEDNLDNETRAKYAALHHSLHDRATTIIDRAAGRAQQMTLAASRWSMLDQSMKEELQWLRVAEQRIPDLTNVTSMDHEQYMNLYQSLSLDVSHHYAKILRLLSITEGLQNLIVCPGLESECSMALETLLKYQENIDVSLIRLTDFKENWLTYDHLINRIEGWVKLANREMENITPENITTTGNLRRFWELKAQHEVHNNLKNECGIQFEKALEILPISDEMVQRQFFSKVEDKWRDLSARISNLHASAIQNISDRGVSSGEKLNLLEDELRELRTTLEGLKGVIKSEDELNLYIERLQVMTSRIDRIQNELGRLSLLPTAESDRLGALLSQSGILDDQIAEELERSMLLKEKIVQVQAGIARVQKGQRRARLTLEECETAERLGSDVVERASQNCERLLEDLSSQWKEILALRQALHTLPISLRICVSPTSIERDISALQETHAELEAACNDLSARLRSKLQLWRRFERQLELVQGAVREADYMVELLTVQGQVDYDRLLKATERLETLSESLSRRSGELVGELRDTAAPLEASTEPSVSAKLRRQLDDAAAAYEHTCANLTQLCDKYHKAVDLWSRYREAAAAVRAFAESQEGRLHALRPDDAPATANACLEQEARVAELRSLAARVAAETGSRALQADADALARRLQLVAGAVQALADLGEARQVARAKAQHAKEMFCDMRQDLTPVHEDGEIVEDKLIALRDNLIALGKSEADIAPAKAELPEIDRDVSEEHSIVRILELWQAMFRDTFLHYHRLSTALIRSGDAATAFKLWHEYLLDLQSFLSSTVPADYENLTEHRRLCRVHRNLLASQRSVLINENRDTNNRDLADKFDTLTNLHNETLAKIVERHEEVSTRIAAWDNYREIYTELLKWLKELEREKEKLQLRYVHIKRINKTLTQVQNLADKLPEGRKFAEKLFSNLKKVLEFTEDTYGASARMEYAGIVKRVDNLQASLDTWRDFLTRILGLIAEYETLTSDLHKLYAKTQNDIMTYSDEERLSRSQIKKTIDKFIDLRTKIDKTEIQTEALSVIQEQLKECLSPQDIRIVNQKVWQLRQQRADLEHQLSIIIHKLQERLEIYTIFDSRLLRFSEWLKSVELRLESTTSSEAGALDPHDLIKRINSDLQSETAMKEREFEWLTETGIYLVDLSKKDEKSYSKNTSKQLKDVQERWHNLQESRRSRIAKITELLITISQLEERLTEIRTKLHMIESKLSMSVILEHLTTKAVDSQFQSRDEIHKDIENESEEVGNTLNLCELVFNDPDVLKGNFDLRNLRTGVEIVDKKWKNICDMSEQRKTALKEIRKSAELGNSLLPKVEKKLDAIERRVEKVEARKQRGENEDESVSKAVIKDLDGLESDVKKLEDAYGRVVSARGIELRGNGADDAARLRSAVRRWQQLRVRVDAAGADAHRQFVAAHGKAVVALAEADVRLTRALHLSPTPTDKEAILKELEGVERDLQECETYVEAGDRLATAVMSVAGVADMVAEYRALYTDVRMRLDIARAEVVGDVDTAVQVDTLRWETDAALQVDTLTSKETYRVELASAVKEASEALEALRTALLHEIPENAPSEELANAAKEIAKAGIKPSQTLELAKHLSELLLTECDATEDEAMLKEVESLALRYEDLLNQAKKRELQINNLRLPHSASYALTCEHESGRLTCPLCSDRNWKQLDNDLWRLEQWLQFAEAMHEARHEPPEQYDALEDTIQDHREFLLDLDSHKALIVSLNVVGSHVARHARDASAADRVRERLADANRRWDEACARAAEWQTKLQRALVHNREFHDIVVELVSQLGNAERLVRSREPLRLTLPAEELRTEFRRFSELRDELSRAEPRVLALRDAAQLLHGNDSQDVCRRLGELRLRLQSLRKLSAVYALKLGAALANQPSATGSALAAAAATLAPQLMQEDQEPTFSLPPLTDNDVPASDETEERSLSGVQRGLRFVCRVARASLPFQALLLLLLGAAALAPHTQTDCRATPSLQPVLRYPDGPPPI